MRPWKTRERQMVFTHPYINLEMHTVELPDGRIIQDWPWVDTPDYINVLPETTAGEYLVFRQMKYAVEGLTLAPVGGYIEPDEKPLEAAKRELREETGYEASEWTSLGVYPVDMNRGAGSALRQLSDRSTMGCSVRGLGRGARTEDRGVSPLHLAGRRVATSRAYTARGARRCRFVRGLGTRPGIGRCGHRDGRGRGPSSRRSGRRGARAACADRLGVHVS